MLGVLYKKMHIGVIRPRIRVRNEISRFLKFLSSSTSRLRLLDLTPDSSSCPGQLLRAYFRSKGHIREVYELDPPFWDLSRECWDARSDPLLPQCVRGRRVCARASAAAGAGHSARASAAAGASPPCVKLTTEKWFIRKRSQLSSPSMHISLCRTMPSLWL